MATDSFTVENVDFTNTLTRVPESEEVTIGEYLTVGSSYFKVEGRASADLKIVNINDSSYYKISTYTNAEEAAIDNLRYIDLNHISTDKISMYMKGNSMEQFIHQQPYGSNGLIFETIGAGLYSVDSGTIIFSSGDEVERGVYVSTDINTSSDCLFYVNFEKAGAGIDYYTKIVNTLPSNTTGYINGEKLVFNYDGVLDTEPYGGQYVMVSGLTQEDVLTINSAIGSLPADTPLSIAFAVRNPEMNFGYMKMSTTIGDLVTVDYPTIRIYMGLAIIVVEDIEGDASAGMYLINYPDEIEVLNVTINFLTN